MTNDDGGYVVSKQFADILFSIETAVDAGFATSEMIARLEAEEARRRAAWLALPFYVRWWRTLRARLYEPERRIRNAFAALRGGWEASDDE